MTTLRTERLLLRNWRDDDRDLFERINSDARVMEFFVSRLDRAASDALMDELRGDIAEAGHGFAAVEIAATGACAGFCGIQPVDLAPHLPDGAFEIGWRFAPDFWRQGIASEAALAWLGYAFDVLALDEIYAFAVALNRPSISVMERIGMCRVDGGDFHHPAIPKTHAWLQPFVLYRMTHAQWRKRKGAAAAAP
jgi:RimJ/RimL family protein N-acetyltransferase